MCISKRLIHYAIHMMSGSYLFKQCVQHVFITKISQYSHCLDRKPLKFYIENLFTPDTKLPSGFITNTLSRVLLALGKFGDFSF